MKLQKYHNNEKQNLFFRNRKKGIIFEKRLIIIIIILEIRQLGEDALTREKMLSAKYVTYSIVPSFNNYLEFQFLLTFQ